MSRKRPTNPNRTVLCQRTNYDGHNSSLLPNIVVWVIIIIIIFISQDKNTYPKLQLIREKSINSRKYLHIIFKNYSVTKNVLKSVSVDPWDRG